jgi:hypothetical protein
LLFAYERFDLWASPAWTAGLILLYFAGAVVIGLLFRGAPFCSHVCPLGQFALVSSLISPLEVKALSTQACADCRTHDCIKGSGDHPGCEPGLFLPKKVGNMNCHLRLDCSRACPTDNVGIVARLPASELWLDPVRSGVGRFSRRIDLGMLVVVYVFGALLNAFGMVAPVYELQTWLAGNLSTHSETIVLGVIFVAGLGVIPAVLLGLTGLLTRWGTGSQERLSDLVTRYVYALVPMGFGVWLAHFSFHFLTGVLTIVPVAESVLIDLGWRSLGPPSWHLGPIVPGDWLFPMELGMLGLGWFGSLLVAYRIAEREEAERTWWAFLPWTVLITILLLAAVWLMAQPMEMRGTVFAS